MDSRSGISSGAANVAPSVANNTWKMTRVATRVVRTEPLAHRIWRRFTPAHRMARFVVYLLAGLAIAAAIRTVEIIPEFLTDAPEQVADLLTRMWPIDIAYYLTGVHAALTETLHIASLGTLLALVMAIPVGLLAARNICPFTSLNLFAKLILVSSRSVNSLVWALLFVGIFGPGALAGTLAIAFRSIGFVGKLFGEAIEETARGPIEALDAAGAPWLFRLGFWCLARGKPPLLAVALFFWGDQFPGGGGVWVGGGG